MINWHERNELNCSLTDSIAPRLFCLYWQSGSFHSAINASVSMLNIALCTLAAAIFRSNSTNYQQQFVFFFHSHLDWTLDSKFKICNTKSNKFQFGQVEMASIIDFLHHKFSIYSAHLEPWYFGVYVGGSVFFCVEEFPLIAWQITKKREQIRSR